MTATATCTLLAMTIMGIDDHQHLHIPTTVVAVHTNIRNPHPSGVSSNYEQEVCSGIRQWSPVLIEASDKNKKYIQNIPKPFESLE